MRIIQHLTDRLDMAVTDDGEVALVVYTKGERVVCKVPDIDEMISALRAADLIAMEQKVKRYSGPCMARMVHEDKSVMPCVLQKTHLLNDSDHEDAHGHRAPVLVHQSTIREVKAIQDARDAGFIK